MKERLGTDIDLLPETEGDARRAKLVDFGASQDKTEANASAMFKPTKPVKDRIKVPKTAKENRADALRKQLLGNTRAAMNPFGGGSSKTAAGSAS